MKTKHWMLMAITGLVLTLAPSCVVYRDRPEAVVVQEAPPPPQAEVVPVSPGPDYVWIDGYWAWNGRWVWTPGRWKIRPHLRAVWAPGHWIHGRHGWVWAPGHWR